MKISIEIAELLAIRYHELVKASEAYEKAPGSSKEREPLATNLENAKRNLGSLDIGLLDEGGQDRFPAIYAAYERAANLLCPPAEQTHLSLALKSSNQRGFRSS
jgi:hypothetical protein